MAQVAPPRTSGDSHVYLLRVHEVDNDGIVHRV